MTRTRHPVTDIKQLDGHGLASGELGVFIRSLSTCYLAAIFARHAAPLLLARDRHDSQWDATRPRERRAGERWVGGGLLPALQCAALLGAACAGGAPAPIPTLDGQPPLVIAHRGASGYLPEETLEAYKKAIELGADAIEPDLISTQDGVLIARHDPNLIYSTDVASHPEFAARKKTVAVDGEMQEGYFEDKLLAMIEVAGLNRKEAPIFVQSFEPSSLKYLRQKGLRTRAVQLIDAAGVDYKTGELTYAVPSDRPYDWTVAGDRRLYRELVTPAGLSEISGYADGIGPWKRYIISAKGVLGSDGSVRDVNDDGKINDADTTTLAPTELIAAAHRAGLFVHPYTFRNEGRRLAADYAGDPRAEYKAFFRLGVDGVFSDFTDTALAARGDYLGELGD